VGRVSGLRTIGVSGKLLERVRSTNYETACFLVHRLDRYWADFDFRYNNRRATDAERAKALPSKRLTRAANTSAKRKSGLM